MTKMKDYLTEKSKLFKEINKYEILTDATMVAGDFFNSFMTYQAASNFIKGDPIEAGAALGSLCLGIGVEGTNYHLLSNASNQGDKTFNPKYTHLPGRNQIARIEGGLGKGIYSIIDTIDTY